MREVPLHGPGCGVEGTHGSSDFIPCTDVTLAPHPRYLTLIILLSSQVEGLGLRALTDQAPSSRDAMNFPVARSAARRARTPGGRATCFLGGRDNSKYPELILF